MKISLKKTQNKNPLDTSKVRQSSQEISVFSYDVKKGPLTVVLSQQETGFTLSIKMEKLENILRITNFNLNRCLQLAYLSPELNDTALLEIVLQALPILFEYAQQYYADEIFFILSQEDAINLTDFEGFFDDTASLATQEGRKMSFTVRNTPAIREFLAAKMKTIQTKLKQELWQIQRGDRYIRNYLQNHLRGTLLPSLPLKSKDERPSRGNVILFPQGSNNDN